METNENEKLNPIEKTIENTKETNEQTIIVSTITPQETQRIDLISELLKNQEISKQSSDNQTANVTESEQQNANTQPDKQPSLPHNSEIHKKQTAQNNASTEKHTQDKKDYRLERSLLDTINAMQSKILESLELIKKFERINAKEENLPNIVTTLRDKLTQEVIKQCRTVGIEFNMNSYLVQSIVSDLLSKFGEGITEFKECSENLNFVREVQDDFESRVELKPTNKVKNLISRLRGLFRPENKQKIIEDCERKRQERKLEEANIHLIKYKFLNNELSKYTIRKNIVESLTHEILYGEGSSNVSIEEFIKNKIEPEMKKLGLQYLMPNLKESIQKECIEKIGEIQLENLLQMTITDIKKSMKLREYKISTSKIVITEGSKETPEEEQLNKNEQTAFEIARSKIKIVTKTEDEENQIAI